MIFVINPANYRRFLKYKATDSICCLTSNVICRIEDLYTIFFVSNNKPVQKTREYMEINTEPRLVYHSVLDGLVRAFVTSKNPELEQKLYELCGFSKRQIKDAIPIETYVVLVDYLAETFYPDIPKQEAYKLIGRRMVDGYENTILGRVQFAASKVISPYRAAHNAPRNLKQNSNFVIITFEEITPTKFLYKFSNTPLPGEILAGTLEAGIGRTRAKNVRTTHTKTGPESYEILLEWD